MLIEIAVDEFKKLFLEILVIFFTFLPIIFSAILVVDILEVLVEEITCPLLRIVTLEAICLISFNLWLIYKILHPELANFLNTLNN